MIAEIGTAKPTPSLAPESVSICWLMPTTRAPASSSGPPELPGLIEASVWIAPSIWNWVSDLTERSVAETIPTESDCCSPKGLPIAATGWPTCEVAVVAELQRVQVEAVGLDLEQGDVGEGVEADDLRRDHVAVGELDEDCLGRLARLPLDSSVTTWALVTISPSVSRTKPEPSAAPLPSKIERIVTTPGAASR